MGHAKTCPISAIARILGRRWMLELIFFLRYYRRFRDLQAATGDLNPATLTQRLRELEREGLVSRTIVSNAPVQIEYALTEKGRALDPTVDALVSWSGQWDPEKARQAPPAREVRAARH